MAGGRVIVDDSLVTVTVFWTLSMSILSNSYHFPQFVLMWVILLVIIVLATILTLLVLFMCWRCCKEKNETTKSKEPESVVSLSFPLPPPVGETDDMDETQYERNVVRTFRHHELGESEEGRIEKNEDYVNNAPRRKSKARQLMEERKQSSKDGPRFLFEAPPAYDETTDAGANQSGEKRRMVSLKMPDLPVRKVGDTQILNFREAPTQSLSSTTMTAILKTLNESRREEPKSALAIPTRVPGPSTRSISAETPYSNTLREPSAEQEHKGSSEAAKASDRKAVKPSKVKKKRRC
ncbi:unnamed protein product [Cylicocyclus nassatus]|uniref:Uncharacterized protein n=1 Tax=Cylicocyclus nassatus TaxID=53992 RepID=A0AA36GQD2_CYLNA|nr:unnamed protein product [Cylicocyclus nassatus]